MRAMMASRATSTLWLRILAPVGGFALAILGHAWNNSLPLFMALAAAQAGEAAPIEVLAPPTYTVWDAMITASLTNLVVFLPFALLLAFILYRSGQAERRVLVEELADAVGVLREVILAEPGDQPDQAEVARVLRSIARKLTPELVVGAGLSSTLPSPPLP